MATIFDLTSSAANSQKWEEDEDDVVYKVTLKRVQYYSDNSAIPGDDEPVARLQWQTCKVRTLKAATIDKLVANLAPEEDNVDPTYMQAFLSTYRSYTDAGTLLEKLIARYRSEATNGKGEVIRKSVRSVLRTWLDLYPDDFNSPPYHKPLVTLMEFLEQDSPQGIMVEVANLSRKLFEQFKTSVLPAEIGQKEMDDVKPSRSHVDFMSLDASDIAYQLTIIDSKLFCRVVPYHTMGCVWGKRNKAELAPTVHQTVQQFNRISMLVVTSILLEGKFNQITTTTHQVLIVKGPSVRAKIISRWLDVALECRHFKNFSSLKAILSGLQSSPIHRLKRTWAVVSKDNREAFDELSELFSQEKNQQNTRQLLMKNLVLGVVPYLGTFLTDLMMIDTAYPSKVRGDLINFEKRRKEFEVLAQLTLFQKSAANYVLPEDKALQEWLKTVDILSEQESYELSCQVESVESDVEAGPQRSATLTQKFRNLFGSKPAGLDSDQPVSEPGSPIADSSDDESVFDKSKSLPGNSRRRMSFDLHAARPSKVNRQISANNLLSPSNCIIRVTLDNPGDTHCMYKSVMLNCEVRTNAVVAMALEKLGVDGSPQDYSLIQIVHSKKKIHIPENTNVFYAIDKSASQFRFVLERKQSEQTGFLAVPDPSRKGHTRARSVSPTGNSHSSSQPQSQEVPVPGIPRRKHSRSNVDLSESPPAEQQLFRPSESTCVIRVALDSAEKSTCVYKSMLVTCNDHTPAVIVSAMEKLGVQGEPTDYELVYVPDGKKRIVIPRDANVFYAIDNTSDSLKLFLSARKSANDLASGDSKGKITRHRSFSEHQSPSSKSVDSGFLSVPVSPVKSCQSVADLHSGVVPPFGAYSVPFISLPTSHVIRVAYRESAIKNCVYKSLLLTCDDHACSVIKAAMDKLGLDGRPNEYVLIQEIDPKKNLRFPHNANVFYAMDSSPSNFSFVLERRHQRDIRL